MLQNSGSATGRETPAAPQEFITTPVEMPPKTAIMLSPKTVMFRVFLCDDYLSFASSYAAAAQTLSLSPPPPPPHLSIRKKFVTLHLTVSVNNSISIARRVTQVSFSLNRAFVIFFLLISSHEHGE